MPKQGKYLVDSMYGPDLSVPYDRVLYISSELANSISIKLIIHYL